MPLYEYECEACEHRFEVIQKFSDPPIERCPKCGGKVRKLFASPAIQFKGSGWYITDYARKDPRGGSAKNADAGSTETASRDEGAKAAEAKDAGSGASDATAKSDKGSSESVAPAKPLRS